MQFSISHSSPKCYICFCISGIYFSNIWICSFFVPLENIDLIENLPPINLLTSAWLLKYFSYNFLLLLYCSSFDCIASMKASTSRPSNTSMSWNSANGLGFPTVLSLRFLILSWTLWSCTKRRTGSLLESATYSAYTFFSYYGSIDVLQVFRFYRKALRASTTWPRSELRIFNYFSAFFK